MNDQVAALKAANIPVETINSKTSHTDRIAILDDLRCGHPRTRLLYVTPELCLTDSFRKHLHTVYEQNELVRFAIDEAHCISEWGHDFRPAYSHLAYLRTAFSKVPIICLTATATPRVRQDIISVLNLNPSTLKTFLTSTARANLHFEVRYTSYDNDIRMDYFIDWLKAVHARRASDPDRAKELSDTGQRQDAVSGIIYAATRADCDILAEQLQKKSIGAVAYHAGLDTLNRVECQRKWIAGEPGFEIVVATTAFGMGIDKENVRFVVHWNVPKSFEGFYQEAGRAGRDGRASLCMLFYGKEDAALVADRISMDSDPSNPRNSKNGGAKGAGGEAARKRKKEAKIASFKALVEYCENTDKCRHEVISEYFVQPNKDGLQSQRSLRHALSHGDANAYPTPGTFGPLPIKISPSAAETAVKNHLVPGNATSPVAEPQPLASPCDYACDICKSKMDVKKRKEFGLTRDDELCSSTQEYGALAGYDGMSGGFYNAMMIMYGGAVGNFQGGGCGRGD